MDPCYPNLDSAYPSALPGAGICHDIRLSALALRETRAPVRKRSLPCEAELLLKLASIAQYESLRDSRKHRAGQDSAPQLDPRDGLCDGPVTPRPQSDFLKGWRAAGLDHCPGASISALCRPNAARADEKTARPTGFEPVTFGFVMTVGSNLVPTSGPNRGRGRRLA
jgi:hypothetical protein